MRLYLQNINELASKNTEFVTTGAGKSVYITEEGKSYTYIRCGKGTQKIDSTLFRVVAFIKALCLSLITLGIAPAFSVHIRENFKGRAIVALYLIESKGSSAAKTDTAAQTSLKPLTHINCQTLSEIKRQELFGKWPQLKTQNLQKLTSSQAIDLLKTDVMYISGFSEAQKKEIAPCLSVESLTSNTQEQVHYLRHIDVQLLSKSQKSAFQYTFKLPDDAPRDELIRMMPVLAKHYITETQYQTLVKGIDIAQINSAEFNMIFGSGFPFERRAIHPLSTEQLIALAKREIRCISECSSEQRKKLFETPNLTQMLDIPLFGKYLKPQYNEMESLRQYFTNKEITKLQGLALHNYIELFPDDLNKLSCEQLVEVMHLLTYSTFKQLSKTKQDYLLCNPRIHTIGHDLYYNLTSEQAQLYISSMNMKGLSSEKLNRFLFSSGSIVVSTSEFEKLSGRQLLDLANDHPELIKSLKFYSNSTSSAIIKKLAACRMTQYEFDLFFSRTGKYTASLSQYLTCEDIFVFWPLITNEHLLAVENLQLALLIEKLSFSPNVVQKLFDTSGPGKSFFSLVQPHLQPAIIKKFFNNFTHLFSSISYDLARRLYDQRHLFTAEEIDTLKKENGFCANHFHEFGRGWSHNYNYNYNSRSSQGSPRGSSYGSSYGSSRSSPNFDNFDDEIDTFKYQLTLTNVPKDALFNLRYEKIKQAQISRKWFDVFDLPETADLTELDKKRKMLTLKLHPDRHPNNIEASTKITAALNEIYTHLKTVIEKRK